MLRYHIDHVSGEYIKPQELEHKVGYTTSQLLPDVELAEHEYLAMLDADGKVQYWPDDTDCTWQVKTRFEKVTAYHKQTQQTKQFDDKSLVPTDYTLLPPPTLYHDFVINEWVYNTNKAIEAKRKEINDWRNALEHDESQTVLAINHEWDAGPNARLRIDSTLLTEQMPPYWTDATNVDHKGMTLEELKQVKIAINEFGFAIHDRQRTMKKEVEALTDFDEILNYPVGWPQS